MIILIIISCSSNNDNGSLNVIDEISYNVGFRSANICHYEYNGKEYVAFSDFRTFKCIEVFDIFGSHVNKIDLADMVTKTGRPITYSMISNDSIFLLMDQTNIVYIIDNKGNIIGVKDYSELKSYGVELLPPIYINNNNFRTSIFYDEDFHDGYTENMISSFREKEHCFYHLMEDTTFYGDTPPLLQMDSIYNRFVAKDGCIQEGNHILMMKSQNILYSAYSDSLYVFSINGDLVQVKNIKSDYGRPMFVPSTYDELHKNPIISTEQFKNNISICDLLWDKYKNIYYCFIRRKMEKNSMPFSIIVLDCHLNRLKEFDLGGEDYYATSFVGERGLYIMKKNQSFDKLYFTIFNYEE